MPQPSGANTFRGRVLSTTTTLRLVAMARVANDDCANHLDPTGKKVAPADFEADVTRNFDFSATTTITDAEAQLLPTIVSNLTDEIFNKLFSNW